MRSQDLRKSTTVVEDYSKGAPSPLGNGFFLSLDDHWYLVTCYHVVRELLIRQRDSILKEEVIPTIAPLAEVTGMRLHSRLKFIRPIRPQPSWGQFPFLDYWRNFRHFVSAFGTTDGIYLTSVTLWARSLVKNQ